MDLALHGDIRYAGESARFAETYVKVGLVPGAGGAHFLPRLVGVAKALECSGPPTSSRPRRPRASPGEQVVPDAELMPQVRALAAKIADAPQLSVRYIKRAIYQGMRNDLRTNLDLISSHYGIVTASEEHRNAVEAFKNRKRANLPLACGGEPIDRGRDLRRTIALLVLGLLAACVPKGDGTRSSCARLPVHQVHLQQAARVVHADLHQGRAGEVLWRDGSAYCRRAPSSSEGRALDLRPPDVLGLTALDQRAQLAAIGLARAADRQLAAIWIASGRLKRSR